MARKEREEKRKRHHKFCPIHVCRFGNGLEKAAIQLSVYEVIGNEVTLHLVSTNSKALNALMPYNNFEIVDENAENENQEQWPTINEGKGRER